MDEGTKFNSACFLYEDSTNNASESFLYIWTGPYIEYPNAVLLDLEVQFSESKLLNFAYKSRTFIKRSGVESHNAIGVGERFKLICVAYTTK